MDNKEHKIRFWGVRGSFPSPRKDTIIYGGHTSCVEIRTAKNELIILDMGTGFLDLGNSLMNEDNSPDDAHIILSHYHWDHIQGFPFFSYIYQNFRPLAREDKYSWYCYST